MSTPTTQAASTPANRHALTAVEKQKGQLERLLRDPQKPAHIPLPPKQKTIRPPREMMKNVQGSSAGAGSGEFHVYKASRRREYERLKLLEETVQKESADAEFERKRREAEEAAEAKTAKNRAKRQKKKDRAKAKGAGTQADTELSQGQDPQPTVPIKKRRLVNGKEMIFRQPGEESDDSEDVVPPSMSEEPAEAAAPEAGPVAELPKITFIEE
ncbi:hypothetical protein C0993_001696 [Termitomyces sp. T159_Od127]|nr:hypothetical protein C0993_001696 [Termitomyces sp. T159_Od127]